MKITGERLDYIKKKWKNLIEENEYILKNTQTQEKFSKLNGNFYNKYVKR
jgi:hypothetical protein